MSPLPRKTPTTVKVGAHIYTVLLCALKEMPKGEPEEKLLGYCEYDTNLIYIYKYQPASRVKDVLLHEILHACGYPGLTHKTLDEETFVDTISSPLLEVLQDNPELVMYLTS